MAEEAILLASSAGEVREYLRKRAERAGFFDRIGAEAEAELLARSERLIDLSLAEYCLHRETAQLLFERDSDDWPVRALILSNCALARSDFRDGFPGCLFASEEALLSYLGSISSDERSVLFTNPGLSEDFLDAFLSMGKPWEAMDEQQRLWALHNLAENAKLQRKRSARDFDDGWDEYVAGKPFAAAWSLIEKLEPGFETARGLAAVLRDLPAESFKPGGVTDALDGWRATGEDATREAEDNAKGRLSAFQEVRQAGARLLASRHKMGRSHFLDSEDLAFRCGGYEASSNLDKKAMEAAVQQDGDLARVHLVRNESLWRSEKSRDLLLDLLRGSESDEPRWEFGRRDRHFREEHPEWFTGEDYSEPDKRPISDSSIADVVAGITGDPAIKGLQERLTALEDRQRNLVWMAALAIVLLVLLTWR